MGCMSDKVKESALKGYQWPADRLSTAEMQILLDLRMQTGIPINHLLKLAIEILPDYFESNGKNKA